jgi:hypothetical protein
MEMGTTSTTSGVTGDFLRNYKSGGYTLEHYAKKLTQCKLGKQTSVPNHLQTIFRGYEESLKS